MYEIKNNFIANYVVAIYTIQGASEFQQQLSSRPLTF